MSMIRKFRMRFRQSAAGMGAALALWAAGAYADLTNTWHFTNRNQYAVSDPALIEVNETPPGYAQLILQAQECFFSTLDEFTNATSYSRLRFGPLAILRLSGTPGNYNSPGTFTSRIFDSGGAVWDMLQFRAWNIHYVPDPDLLAYYRMDNDQWVDAITGLRGTPTNGPSFVADAKGGTYAGRFRGNAYQDGVALPNQSLLSGKSGCTLMCWFKGFQQTAEYEGILASRSADSTRFWGFQLWTMGATSVSFLVRNGTGPYSYAVAPYQTNRWYFLVGTYDSTGDRKARLYVDGVLYSVAGNVADAGSIVQTAPFFLGKTDYVLPTRHVNAVIDEAAIFGRVLSSNEIALMYKSYARTKPLLFQVRSGTTPADVQTRTFVGPDGTADTYYSQPAEKLVECPDFSVSNRYAQYRAYLYASTNNALTPYIEAAGFVARDSSAQNDCMLNEWKAGQFTANTTWIPETNDTPYLGLSLRPNGGYATNGTYTSRELDAGASVNWLNISWFMGEELSASIPGLVGLWHMNETWAPAKGTVFGTPVDGAFTTCGKLGSGSAVFNGSGAHTVFSFSPAQTVRAVELWVRADEPRDGLFRISYGGGGSAISCAVSNRCVYTYPTNVVSTIIVNGSDRSARLLPGWNLVVVSFDRNISMDELDLGVADGDYFRGAMDELALYDRTVTPAEAKAHFISGRRQAAGRARAQVRYGNTLPLSGAFVGPGGLPSTFYDNGQALGVLGQRYLQYLSLIHI